MFLSADDQCRGKITTEICLHIHAQYPLTGLSLRAGGRGFSPATKRVAPGYFY